MTEPIAEGNDDIRMLVLAVTGIDMEAVPQIVQLLNVYECRSTPFSAEEIVPVVAEMFFAGLLHAYIDTQTDNGRRNVAFTAEHLRAQFGEDAENVLLRRLQTPANLAWSSWPSIGAIWFEPTEEGERVWERREHDCGTCM